MFMMWPPTSNPKERCWREASDGMTQKCKSLATQYVVRLSSQVGPMAYEVGQEREVVDVDDRVDEGPGPDGQAAGLHAPVQAQQGEPRVHDDQLGHHEEQRGVIVRHPHQR